MNTPILILFHTSNQSAVTQQETIRDQLQLDEYFENWNITPLLFDDYRLASYSLMLGLEWIASNSERQPKIESESLREFAEEKIFRYSKVRAFLLNLCNY